MIIKPFGEKGIPMLQGNIKDVSIIKENICALLKKQIDKPYSVIFFKMSKNLNQITIHSFSI